MTAGEITPFPVIGAWTLRRATGADLDRLVALESEIFRSDAWPHSLWRSELESPHTWYLVVVRADAPAEVLGYAGLLSLPHAHDADVQTIGLSAELRGHGLGRALMGQLHAEARRRGIREMFLDVRVDNPVAQALYRSFGYEQIGVRKGYYQPDNVDAYVMKAVL
ncbi:ribosomal protein S18-alanine N-acetyltransferase [Gryllotalpicola reticulitermitis]|uniref:Ribosomal protein S18-alanine N-acetyltransferase n=1 Tax=Gryllotalpicola reticulitermitis TaxID=1184153 RepID=A0ABV8Q4F6_9MICO